MGALERSEIVCATSSTLPIRPAGISSHISRISSFENLPIKIDNLPKQLRAKLETVKKLYDQQKYMYDNHTHSVPDRIVSIVSNHHAINRIAFSLS